MSWADAVRLAFRSVLRRPGRAAITVVAVALAAGLFTAMLAMAGTARTRVLDQFAKGGSLAGITVAAAEGDPGQLDTDNPRPGGPLPIDETVLARIARLPDVRLAVPVVSTRAVVVLDEALVPAAEGDDPPRVFDSVVGIDLGHADALPITVLAGRLPEPGSLTEVAVTPAHLQRSGIERARADAVVGTELALGFPRGFQSEDRGGSVRGRWVRAEVVGLVAQEAGTGGVLASIEQVAAGREWTAAGYSLGDDDERASPYSGLFVVARSLDKVPVVRAGIAAMGYSTSAPENLIATVQRYVRVVEIVLAGIGAIALGIAALGVANALLAAVRERRREIGVLKAVGARDRDVLRIFLIEAAVMGALGGALGAGLGTAVAWAVTSSVDAYLRSEGLAGVDAGLPTDVGLLALGGAVALAMVAGILPARRAARLPAREAVDL